MRYVVARRKTAPFGYTIAETDITDVTNTNIVHDDRHMTWTHVLITNMTLSEDKRVLAALVHAMSLFQKEGLI